MFVEIVTVGIGTARLPENLSMSAANHVTEVAVVRLLSDLYVISLQRARTKYEEPL